FSFTDSKPHERRFETGNVLDLIIGYDRRNPHVLLEGSRAVFRPILGLISLGFLIAYMVGAFAVYYSLQSKGYGWRFFTWGHPWMLSAILGIVIMLITFKALHSFGSEADTDRFLLYCKKAHAVITDIRQTGTYINEQPEVLYSVTFRDDRGAQIDTTLKKVVSLISLHRLQEGPTEILYMPEDPRQIMIDF
ncbi:MAG: hypothetical protein Q4C71_06035, partial [Microbacteriaceae bacterium]|nr:hypothetical protein [Microbacteriaceae bacterium]